MFSATHSSCWPGADPTDPAPWASRPPDPAAGTGRADGRNALVSVVSGSLPEDAGERRTVKDAQEHLENGVGTPAGLTPPEGVTGSASAPVRCRSTRRGDGRSCRAVVGVVSFCGTVRDHSEGRPGVTSLEYEAYVEQVAPRLSLVADSARERWAEIGRLVLLHRVGRLEVGDVSVVVVASTPHRAEAFAAAQFCIDTLKHTVPIWKRETWTGGTDWSVCSPEVDDADPQPATGAMTGVA